MLDIREYIEIYEDSCYSCDESECEGYCRGRTISTVPSSAGPFKIENIYHLVPKELDMSRFSKKHIENIIDYFFKKHGLSDVTLYYVRASYDYYGDMVDSVSIDEQVWNNFAKDVVSYFKFYEDKWR